MPRSQGRRRAAREDVALTPTDVAASHDLRVTARCCAADLSEPPGTTLEELARRHEIVAKFRKMRAQHPTGMEKLRDVPSRLDIFNLHAGRERGVTWHDRQYDVVWLLAVGHHSSGDIDDAYPHFVKLARQGALLPTVDDYELVIRDHDSRDVPVVLAQLNSLSRLAVAKPYESHSIVLANGVRVTLRADVVKERGRLVAVELWLAIAVANLQPGWLALNRAGVLPTQGGGIWDYATTFPDRTYDPTELQFACAFEVATNE